LQFSLARRSACSWSRADINKLGDMIMKKVAILAAAGLLLASVAAFAQMQHPRSGGTMPMPQDHGRMGPGSMPGGTMHEGMMQRGMMGHGMDGGMSSHSAMQPKGDTGPSSLAFHGITARMHAAMSIAFTGNADVDFVKGMIPHHQGAIDMAKTVIAFGKDPEVRKLAEEIIKAQESEIALMTEWLKKNGQ
jgi:uncharacterized protein (DUF305 family)